ncbi:hypothetical protein [Paenibacillus sp. y28]|uniref:hypothetical protein n=1 Tax=Paenibacillus sp. y28 TaxID=3129110 RepID=UPI003017A555
MVKIGNIVETYTFGNSTVHICDDYCVKADDVAEILKKIKALNKQAIYDLASRDIGQGILWDVEVPGASD